MKSLIVDPLLTSESHVSNWKQECSQRRSITIKQHKSEILKWGLPSRDIELGLRSVGTNSVSRTTVGHRQV